jgi:hypothetical protein
MERANRKRTMPPAIWNAESGMSMAVRTISPAITKNKSTIAGQFRQHLSNLRNRGFRLYRVSIKVINFDLPKSVCFVPAPEIKESCKLDNNIYTDYDYCGQ